MFGDTEVQEYRPVFLAGPQRGFEASGKVLGMGIWKTWVPVLAKQDRMHREDSSFIDGTG